MCDFRMAALMFLTGHEIEARNHACVEIAHFLTWCIIKTWKVLDLRPRAFQALMMYLFGKCAISARAWVFVIM